MINKEKITEIISNIPEDWLQDEFSSLTPAEKRNGYIEFICAKLSMIDSLAKEAADAR